MDDCSETVLKQLCCTCLCKTRTLFQLCRVKDGVNNLYLLLSSDPEAYKEGFYKDTASLYICWECEAVMRKIRSFRQQACIAQKHLTAIVDGRTDTKRKDQCLSRLTTLHCPKYDIIISDKSDVLTENADNFIDCGPAEDIKIERDTDDIPLAELQNICNGEAFNTNCSGKLHIDIGATKSVESISDNSRKQKVNKRIKQKKIKSKTQILRGNKYYTTTIINEQELSGYREKRKLVGSYLDATVKCDTCLEGFKGYIELEKHNSNFHKEKEDYIQCNICQVYIPNTSSEEHRTSHYQKHSCHFCDYVCYNLKDILTHLKGCHAMKSVTALREKVPRSINERLVTSGSKCRTRMLADKRTPFGFKCPDCDKYFDSKNLRYKHIRRHHREGYSCTVCGKRYPFKDNLVKHERLHQGPLPREECQICHKMIRFDLVKTHARIHTKRETFSCVECNKKYISRASYENHLKYSQVHAAVDVLKFKCSMCDKGYRSKGELRDHINYQHLGKTQHQCPVCGKALATRRCITRHVRRAHHHIKESPRDKICQQCGKAFRDKKGLREHEFIHTGERPLACEICGCTFRQNASLYTHRKRIHKIYPQKKNIELVKTS